MNIKKSITEIIGKTPLLELKNYERSLNLDSEIIAKIEYLNPAGSAKDRVANQIILDYEKKGLLKEGSVIIEPTSGNTGIGLAAICAAKNYKLIIVLPDSMSTERRNLIKAYGAELVLTPGIEGMSGAIKKANELKNEIPGSLIAGQFENPSNPMAHYLTTGPEIYEDTDGMIDYFVVGIGTGGTLSGTGKYLKEKCKNIKIIGVEPASSPVLTKGFSGPHGIQGIGANFIPKTLDTSVYDEVIAVSDNDAFEYARLIAKKEGILVGISSGAALYAATMIAKREPGKRIVVLLPDTGDRYLSTELFK